MSNLRSGVDPLALATKGRVTSYLGEAVVGNTVKLKNEANAVRLKR